MVSDKTLPRAFSTHTILQTKPIREIFHFYYLPKLYIGFKDPKFYLIDSSIRLDSGQWQAAHASPV